MTAYLYEKMENNSGNEPAVFQIKRMVMVLWVEGGPRAEIKKYTSVRGKGISILLKSQLEGVRLFHLFNKSGESI